MGRYTRGPMVSNKLMRCLLLAHSGHRNVLSQCPLLGVKRTSFAANEMPADYPKWTFP
jgi:hypothetical protein